LDLGRRREVLARVERSPLGLALVPWRTLFILHLYEDARELARVGYRSERRRHLAVLSSAWPASSASSVPEPAASGVRLKDGAGDGAGEDVSAEQDAEGAAQGAA